MNATRLEKLDGSGGTGNSSTAIGELPGTIPKGCSAAGKDLVGAAGGIGFTSGATDGLKPEAVGQ
jgi:hypothetical protein